MKKEVKKNSKKKKPIINLKDTVKFFNENLKKKTVIVFIILTLISVIFIVPIINELKVTLGETITLELSLWNFIKDKILLLLMALVAGIVPYMYIAVLGGIGYTYQALIEYAYIIIDKGFFLGTIILIVPFILNLICISVISALGIYICKVNTNKFIISQQRNMNFTRFRLEFAKATQNTEKEKQIQKKIDEKAEKLKNKDTKIKYKEILTIFGIVCILQLISSLIEGLFI